MIRTGVEACPHARYLPPKHPVRKAETLFLNGNKQEGTSVAVMPACLNSIHACTRLGGDRNDPGTSLTLFWRLLGAGRLDWAA